jgi:hypothetical protein
MAIPRCCVCLLHQGRAIALRARPTGRHLASWNGTAPLDASSGKQIRHRRLRTGNWSINRMLHIMTVVQLGNDTEGRAAT